MEAFIGIIISLVTLAGGYFLIFKLWRKGRTMQYRGMQQSPGNNIQNIIHANPLATHLLIVELRKPIRGGQNPTAGMTLRCFGDHHFRSLDSAVLGPIVAINGNIVAFEFDGRDNGQGQIVPETMPFFSWGIKPGSRLYLTTEVRFSSGGRGSSSWGYLPWNARVIEVRQAGATGGNIVMPTNIKPGINRLARKCFILSFFFWPMLVVGQAIIIIFSIKSLVQIRNNGERGTLLAWLAMLIVMMPALFLINSILT